MRGVFTTVTPHFDRVSVHGTPRWALVQQARSLDLPLYEVEIPYPCSNSEYERAVRTFLDHVRHLPARQRATRLAFGDLFLEDVRDYRRNLLADTGFEAVFPLWGLQTRELAETMIRNGLRAVVNAVDPSLAPERLAGRWFDRRLLDDLPSTVDPLGENGEFHTCVVDGPMFSSPVAALPGRVVRRPLPGENANADQREKDGRRSCVYADIVPANPAAASQHKQTRRIAALGALALAGAFLCAPVPSAASPVGGAATPSVAQGPPSSARCVVPRANGEPFDEAGRAETYATHGDERLAALIEEGLANNPQVQAARSAWHASRHRVPQATARPDPALMFTQHVQPPETRVGPQIAMLSVSQRLPGFGKLRLRGRVATAASAEKAELLQGRRAEVVRSIKRAWYDMAFVDRALAINQESQELLERYEALTRARYAQGFGLQADVVRMQAEYTRALGRRDDLERRRIDAEATLNALLARPVDAAHATVEPATLPPAPADAEVLAETGRRARPEIRAAARRVESREHAVALARRSRWPDFSVGVAWGVLLGRDDPAGRAMPPPDNGQDVLSLTAGFNLPIFGQRYDAGVREAAESVAQACALYEGAVNDMERALRSILSSIRSTQRQIALFEDALLPQTEQALYSTEAAYATGTVGVLDLLDGERRLLDVRLGLAGLRTDYMKALADLERAVGSPVEFAAAQGDPPPGGDTP